MIWLTVAPHGECRSHSYNKNGNMLGLSPQWD